MLLTFNYLFFSVTVPEMIGKLYFANRSDRTEQLSIHTPYRKKKNYFLEKNEIKFLKYI